VGKKGFGDSGLRVLMIVCTPRCCPPMAVELGCCLQTDFY
jgi:hypothetical protein